jgi:hypothetical protein
MQVNVHIDRVVANDWEGALDNERELGGMLARQLADGLTCQRQGATRSFGITSAAGSREVFSAHLAEAIASEIPNSAFIGSEGTQSL